MCPSVAYRISIVSFLSTLQVREGVEYNHVYSGTPLIWTLLESVLIREVSLWRGSIIVFTLKQVTVSSGLFTVAT